jgi:hypothetical protein
MQPDFRFEHRIDGNVYEKICKIMRVKRNLGDVKVAGNVGSQCPSSALAFQTTSERTFANE